MTYFVKYAFYLGIAISFLSVSQSRAATVDIRATENNLIFQQGSSAQPKTTLQIDSTDANSMAQILVWQVGIEIVPSVSAVGAVEFAAAEEPDNYLFSGSSNLFLAIPATPSTLDVSDSLLTSITGVDLEFGVPRNLIDLTFSVSSDASGLFHLVISPFSSSPVGGSSWSPQLVLNPADAIAFSNAAAGSTVESRILASIQVINVPEPSCLICVILGTTYLQFFTVGRDR